MSRPEVVAIGTDAGSTTCKLVAVGQGGEVLGSRLEATQPHIERQVGELLGQLCSELGIDGPVPCVATGYGRKLVKDATRSVTEITCHARGVFRDLGHGGTLVDIGGQDSKVIRLGNNGRPVDFVVDTGANLVALSGRQAQRLGIDVRVVGTPSQTITASGVAAAHLVNLSRVKVGDIELRGVEGIVIDGDYPPITLLGMSFLNRLNMRKDGQVMELQTK